MGGLALKMPVKHFTSYSCDFNNLKTIEYLSFNRIINSCWSFDFEKKIFKEERKKNKSIHFEYNV